MYKNIHRLLFLTVYIKRLRGAWLSGLAQKLLVAARIPALSVCLSCLPSQWVPHDTGDLNSFSTGSIPVQARKKLTSCACSCCY